MIAEGIMKRNFPSAFIAILSIINTGIATIFLGILNNLKIRLKYVKNGGHYEIQDGRQKTNSSFPSAFIAILSIINICVATSLSFLGRQK